ncbi:MAG: urate hydroxylase PuuD [Deltaproteobacteria bacterium]|nr:urate hydroxylase PuuD [Deltaproteobacteria bacterium]
MNFALFNADGFLFLLRWIHFLAGITWIGLLYYFNFVQGEFFKEIEAGPKNVAISKLVPRALWWFRWSAMVTFISGLLMITGTMHTGVPLNSSWGVLILIGGGLATVMWANVWFVIWPNQKVVIASATQVLGGGQPIADAAARGAKALLASRHNVLFSIPMLFFMGAARHLILSRDFSQVNLLPLAAILGAIVLLLEINALKGKLGPLTTVKGVIHMGVLLTAVFYFVVELTTR